MVTPFLRSALRASVSALLLLATRLDAQPVLRAQWLTSPLQLDGRLDEPVWRTAPVATNFVQRIPRNGDAATQRSEVRIVYDANAVYVGVRNFDSAPDSIAQQLGRRDADDLYSDWFYVGFDSYGDKRTAFVFGVNPRGVLNDFYITNDDIDNADGSWDAVWNVIARIDSAGWTAEFRIPLSQLRYDVAGAVGAVRPWGLNFSRTVARGGEDSYWAPTPADAPGFVSRFGTLVGLDSLRAPSRTEFIPYVRSQVETQPVAERNRFVPGAKLAGAVGGDARFKLPQSLTLTASINPDFGQVEADPAVVNLSAFEVFFEERRPFFLENADAFAFGATRTFNSSDPPRFFYSRRIGRAPQRSPAGDDLEAVSISAQTPIAGALKLSGTTPSGWQVGVLNASTPHEHADVLRSNGQVTREPVEPFTNYHVSRVRKLLNGGNTGVGVFVADTRRFTDDSLLTMRIPSSATIGGVDWEHAWQNRTYTVSGLYSRSDVRGRTDVMQRLQRANYRSYQRPDATHLDFNPARTALNGHYAALSLAKTAGERLLGSVTYEETSPGFEVNDLGFQVRSDFRSLSTALQYRNPFIDRFSREWSATLYSTHSTNFDGDLLEQRYALFTEAILLNFWEISAFSSFAPATLNDRLLRGGPLAQRPRALSQGLSLSTDRRKTLIFGLDLSRTSDVAGGRSTGVEGSIDWRPLPQMRLRVGPELSANQAVDQYIQTEPDAQAVGTFGARYVFANVRQREMRLNTRLDWTFSPWLSLQLFLQPFASAGEFSRFKEFTTPRDFTFAEYGVDRGTVTRAADGELTVDPDGAGASAPFVVPAQDFTVRALRGNAVLRWEYRPGSSLFFVWSQQREAELYQSNFDVARQLGRAYADPGRHVFLIKYSRWIGR
ncbi:DUF5916 domain-containing protein [Gemmatimonas sp.]|jgi:hypothetical protein|uniref:DUF5916 domain-containing protein n=1 Tax=Gemmatimonas sp. TaxID=1962908 RepID=UPI0037BF79B8